MIHSCIGVEFLNEQELYVLTAHKEGEDFESRIFSYNIETGDVKLLFIFENWIKRFKIIEKETVYASQWDDSIYRLSASGQDQTYVSVGCITDFKQLSDGRLVIVGFDGKICLMSPDRKTENLSSRIERDILYCLPKGNVIYGCGSKGLFFEIESYKTIEVTELQTNCFLTSLCLSKTNDLLISGRGILMVKNGPVIDVKADSSDYYDAIWHNDSFYVCAATKGIVKLAESGLESISDLPSYCICRNKSTIVAGGLDQFTIYQENGRKTVRLDGNILQQIRI